MNDQIHVEALELQVCIGVPDEERLQPQRLTLSMTMTPAGSFTGLNDDITRAVDYFSVCEWVKALVRARPPCRLIETLAEAIAEGLLEQFPLAEVNLELRKFILPDTAYVAVRLTRAK